MLAGKMKELGKFMVRVFTEFLKIESSSASKFNRYNKTIKMVLMK